MSIDVFNRIALNKYITTALLQIREQNNRPVTTPEITPEDLTNQDFVNAHREDIIDVIISSWLKKQLPKYLISQEDAPFFAEKDLTKPKTDLLPGWAQRKTTAHRFLPSKVPQTISNEGAEVWDFLYPEVAKYIDTQIRNGKKINLNYADQYGSFDKVKSAAEKQILEDTKQAEQRAANKKRSLQGAEFVMDLPGGLKAYRLTTPKALDYESDYMGHCVGKGAYDERVKNGTTEIYSIRDETGQPHVTFEIKKKGKIREMWQCKGKGNRAPVAEYRPAVQEFIRQQHFMLAKDQHNTGLIYQDGKYYDIYHLPPKDWPANTPFVIKGDLDLSRQDMTELPDLSNVIVKGSFICPRTITSLKGCPKKVGGDFDCSYTHITSLNGCPQIVGGGFDCSNTQITSLEEAPKKVGGDFNCSYTPITSLKGCPKIVGGDFNCSHTKITSLKECPKEVGGDFNCSYTPITSLEGTPKIIKGNFDCSYTQITSLTSAPKKIGQNFLCRGNQKLTSVQDGPRHVKKVFGLIYQDGQYYDIYHLPPGFIVKGDLDLSGENLTELPDLSNVIVKGSFICPRTITSLKGCPKEVGGNFDCSYTQITSLNGCPQIVGGGFDCSHTKITSLKECPKEVGGDFNCSYTPITSLEGTPKIIKGNFDCSYTQITSFEGGPEKVNGNFYCFSAHHVTSLKGSPKEVGKDFCCSFAQITSFDGGPKKVGGDLNCDCYTLTSLDGAPKPWDIGGELVYRGNAELSWDEYYKWLNQPNPKPNQPRSFGQFFAKLIGRGRG